MTERTSTGTGGKLPNARRLVLLVALVLGLSAAAAAPAEAIVGGREADRQYGQVQFYVFDVGEPGDTGTYVCAGTLINPEWVLTAKHCITDNGANENNSFILAGDRRLGSGAAHPIERIYQNPDADAALLELEDAAGDEDVVGYAAGNDLEFGTTVDIAGWGYTSPAPPGQGTPSDTLKVATMDLESTDYPDQTPGDDDRLFFVDVGEGYPAYGDSGAGVHYDGLIYAIASGVTVDEPDDETSVGTSAVPTNDIAGWIEDTSGVGPSNAGQGCSLAKPSDEEASEGPDPSRDPSSRGRGSGRGASAADFGAAMADLTSSVQNADEDAKELVKDLAGRYPGCNVMVIQQETYEGPQGIEGVVANFQTDFGTNTWDAWVFESGSFTNEGDMGWDNWGWSGKWTRSEDGRTVTFEPIG